MIRCAPDAMCIMSIPANNSAPNSSTRRYNYIQPRSHKRALSSVQFIGIPYASGQKWPNPHAMMQIRTAEVAHRAPPGMLSS